MMQVLTNKLFINYNKKHTGNMKREMRKHEEALNGEGEGRTAQREREERGLTPRIFVRPQG